MIRKRADQKGTETLEFVGLFPLVMLTILIVWQFTLVGYAAIITAGASREGARAAAIDADVNMAVREASSGLEWRIEDRTYGEMRSVTVAIRVPKVPLPFIENIQYPWIYSKATMRYEGYRR